MKSNPKVLEDQMVLESWYEFRHELHENPELGFKEFKTKEIILKKLNSLKFFEKATLKEVLETGFWIDVRGENSNNQLQNPVTIAFRADIDALPLQDTSKNPWKSKIPNMSHACGHDGHITILSAFLEYVLQRLDKLPSNLTIRFLFQPAEEGLFGAEKMIQGNCLENVNEIYGLHNLTLFKVGEIGLVEKAIMAGGFAFEIEISGKGGHGSTPHFCKSPIISAASIVNELNLIIGRDVDSKERAALSIGCFKSGHASNVIPEKAILRGTVRFLSKEIRNLILSKIHKVCEGICLVNECAYKISVKEIAHITYNDPSLTEEVVSKAIERCSLVRRQDNLPIMGGEDFSLYQEVIPGVFFMLGCGDDEHTAYIHEPDYDFNDKALRNGVEMFARILEIKAKINLM